MINSPVSIEQRRRNCLFRERGKVSERARAKPSSGACRDVEMLFAGLYAGEQRCSRVLIYVPFTSASSHLPTMRKLPAPVRGYNHGICTLDDLAGIRIAHGALNLHAEESRANLLEDRPDLAAPLRDRPAFSTTISSLIMQFRGYRGCTQLLSRIPRFFPRTGTTWKFHETRAFRGRCVMALDEIRRRWNSS